MHELMDTTFKATLSVPVASGYPGYLDSHDERDMEIDPSSPPATNLEDREFAGAFAVASALTDVLIAPLPTSRLSPVAALELDLEQVNVDDDVSAVFLCYQCIVCCFCDAT